MFWIIYALVATAVAVAAIITAIKAIITAIKWELAARTIMLFCKEKYREPTDEEVADYTKRTVGKTLQK